MVRFYYHHCHITVSICHWKIFSLHKAILIIYNEFLLNNSSDLMFLLGTRVIKRSRNCLAIGPCMQRYWRNLKKWLLSFGPCSWYCSIREHTHTKPHTPEPPTQPTSLKNCQRCLKRVFSEHNMYKFVYHCCRILWAALVGRNYSIWSPACQIAVCCSLVVPK